MDFYRKGGRRMGGGWYSFDSLNCFFHGDRRFVSWSFAIVIAKSGRFELLIFCLFLCCKRWLVDRREVSFIKAYVFGRAAKLFPKSYALVGLSELSIHFKKGSLKGISAIKSGSFQNGEAREYTFSFINKNSNNIKKKINESISDGDEGFRPSLARRLRCHIRRRVDQSFDRSSLCSRSLRWVRR